MGLLPLLLLLVGCRAELRDADGDGVYADVDCDDADAAVLGGATWYADLDADGYGSEPSVVRCEPEAGSIATGGDCAGEDPAIHPGADERCNGVDDDCDGGIDEDAVDAPTWYADTDGDGFGGAALPAGCDAPAGATGDGTDCDDTDAAVSPVGEEACNGLDDDCDGTVDEPDAVDALPWYADIDGDGFGDPENLQIACDAPAGFLADDTDCDDADSLAFPGGDEVCGGGDEDCDGWVDDDDALDGAPTWYVDVDGDGHGNPRVPWIACDAPDGFVASADDCNDADGTAFPGGTETCDGVDDDCDGTVDDDAVDAAAWYLDLDGDEYGDPATGILDCDERTDRVADATDCDDTELLVNPGMTELCGGGDEDCDGLEADDDPSVGDATAWYLDTDGDGYGEDATEVIACVYPGYIDEPGDCDETDAAIHPEAADACEDGVDQDCYGGDQACTVTGEWGLSSAETVLSADQGALGESVAYAGDVDGDGLTDIVLGANEYNGPGLLSGAAYVIAPVPEGASVDADTSAWIYEGVAANDGAGSAVVGVGDIDGDGLADVAVGANNVAPDQTGAVYLLSGALFVAQGTFSLSDATATFPGEHAWDGTGETLAAVGDLDDDGMDDFVIGAPDDYTGAYHAGSIVIVPGAAYTGTQDTASFVRLLGDDGGMHLAGAIDGAGDFDGDGFDDVIVGAEADTPATGVHAGSAFVVPGPIDSDGFVPDLALLELDGEDPLDEAGTGVAGAGDMNGDGYPDLAVGAPRNTRGGYDTGTVYVISGPLSGVVGLGSADAVVVGVTGGGLAGSSVDGAGDVDGDGFDDLVVGVPRDSTLGFYSGAAYVLYGPVSGSLTLGDSDAHLVGSGGAGSAVAGGGDVNGDGLMDLLVGAPLRGGGTVWVIHGQVR